MNKIHQVRDTFSLAKFLRARELTKSVVEEVQGKVFVGMSEADGHQFIDQALDKLGAEKKWHPNKFRIGKNTIKSFRDVSDENVRLSENDIFFVDIGPVWDGHEGDYGNTFVFGENEKYKLIAKACREVFNKTAKAWLSEGLTGRELYDFAEDYASTLGYDLNNRMKGHRVGDFPHHLFFRGGMIDIDESPCDNLWILEIHLISKDKQFGSFFEDILKK
jgi:Xaa-Pro aminopeptidase